MPGTDPVEGTLIECDTPKAGCKDVLYTAKALTLHPGIPTWKPSLPHSRDTSLALPYLSALPNSFSTKVYKKEGGGEDKAVYHLNNYSFKVILNIW